MGGSAAQRRKIGPWQGLALGGALLLVGANPVQQPTPAAESTSPLPPERIEELERAFGLDEPGSALAKTGGHRKTTHTIRHIPGIDYRHGYAFLAEPKYPPDFTHFDYVNPDAPKGGMLRRHGTGSWDSFNPAALRAAQVVAGLSTSAPHANFLYDALMAEAADEPSTWYGRLAEGIAVAPDGSWIAFTLREGARWHDGAPLTVADVAYTYKIYRDDATSTISTPLKPIERIEVLNEREIRFHIAPDAQGDALLPIRIAQVPILPKHYWETRDISKTTVQPPLGSGPYRVKDFQVGRWIRWERVPDYWGKDLPVMRGRFNFDIMKFDYFSDDRVKTEAVKGDVIDFHVENVPGYWENDYDFPPYEAGVFKREWLPVEQPWGLWWPVFWNLDQPRFQDIRVREALWLVSDFVWLNGRNYDFFDLATSFFHGSELAARDLPDEHELALLEPVRDLVPPRVFTEPYRAPPNAGGGWHRDNLIRAAALLKEAGWMVRDNRLVHKDTFEDFHIRFIAVSPALGNSFIPYTRNLERLGITSSIKSPEISNWLYRSRSGDYDAAAHWFRPSYTPTLLIFQSFASVMADQDYSLNWGNTRDPALDHLISAMTAATTFEEYVVAIRALDRVLLWNFYYVPGMSKTRIGAVFWDRFGRVDVEPLKREVFWDTWWYDEERAANVARFRGQID